MTDLSPAAGAPPAAATTMSGRSLTPAGWTAGLDSGRLERERLIAQARGSDAARQLQRCFPRWAGAFEHLSPRALRQLAANDPVDPNDRDVWRTADEHAQGVLRRHGIALNPRHLTLAAIQELTDGQARADRDAGLDWTRVAVPANGLDEALRRAHANLAIDLGDPGVFGDVGAQRRALAARHGLPVGQGDDLSRWVLSHPELFEDDGFSGATLTRPALERLRDRAAEGAFEVLLCHAPDRLARRYAYQVLLLEELARAGVEVIFARGGEHSGSPEDELLRQFQGMIAEYERAQIRERTRPIRADELDGLVWHEVRRLLEDPALVQAEIDRRLTALRTEHPAARRREELERDLTRASGAIERLIEAYQEQLISLTELRARMPTLRKRQTTLSAQLDALDAELHDAETYLKLADTLEGFLGRLNDRLDQLTLDEQQRILRLVVREVLIGGDDAITIRHSIPTPTGAAVTRACEWRPETCSCTSPPRSCAPSLATAATGTWTR